MKLRYLFKSNIGNFESLITFYREEIYPYAMKNELKSIRSSLNEIDLILNKATRQTLFSNEGKTSLYSEVFDLDNKIENQHNHFKRLYTTQPSLSSVTLNSNSSTNVDTEDKDKEVNPEKISSYCTIVPINDPLVSPDYTDEDEIDKETIIYREDKTIQFISINLFLKKITINPGFLLRQKEIIKGFLQQCSAFIKLNILMEKIRNTFAFFNKKQPNLFQGHLMNNLIQLLNSFILKHYDQIESNDELKKPLASFYSNLFQTEEIQSILFLLSNNCERFDVDYINFLSSDLPPSSPNVYIKYQLPTKPSSANYFSIFDWDEMAIASQLTLITRVMISNIGENEIISAKFAKKNKHESSPNILRLIKRFDDLIFFIIEEVLSYDQKKVRALVIEKWIQIGETCAKMNNYNDCMIITTGLMNHIIVRLHKTWLKVRPEYIAVYDSLKKLCTCQSSYINIRKAINNCIETNQPYIPYLGILLKEIAYYEENFGYIKDNKMINVEKIENVTASIKKFSQFKSFAYTYRPLSQLKIFEKLNPLGEKELEQKFEKLEPNYTLHVYKSNEKRATQTDIKYYNQKPTQSGHLVNAKKMVFEIEDNFYK